MRKILSIFNGEGSTYPLYEIAANRTALECEVILNKQGIEHPAGEFIRIPGVIEYYGEHKAEWMITNEENPLCWCNVCRKRMPLEDVVRIVENNT